MPENLTQQNRLEASQFDADINDVFTQAENAEALDFANQFDGKPADPNTTSNFSIEDMGRGQVKSGEVAIGASKGIGRDVGLGVLHSPRSVARGVTKGINNMVSFIDELDDWIPAPGLFNEKGKFDPGFYSQNQMEEELGYEIGAPQLPVPAPNKTPTVTGSLIEGISQFAVGLKGVDKIGKGVKIGKNMPSLLKNIGRGGAADVLAFDAHDQRLSNVIQQVPALENPVTEFLAADENDNEAVAKLKQTIEGLTLGAAGDVLFDGVKFLKKGKAAKAGLDAEGKTIDDLFDVPAGDKTGVGVEGKDFNFLGDTQAEDLLLRRQKKLDAATEDVGQAFGKTKGVKDGANAAIDDYEINFARIEGADDIKQLMDEMVNHAALKPSVEQARRGKIPTGQTLAAATDIDGFDSLMQRRTGDAFNAEHIVAARQVYYDTTTKLMDAAKRAADPTASAIDQFNFRKMVAVHHAVQKEFMGVRAEAGRALQAWNIPLSGATGGENLRAMEQVLNEFGGVDASKALATRLSDLGNNLNTSQINAITTKGAGARTVDAVSEAWTLGLLTNPATHVVNISSNVLTQFVLGAERFGMALSKDSPVTFREGSEFFTGMLEAQKSALKNAAQAFRTGQTGLGISKLDLPRTRNTAREILDPEGKAGIFSKALDGYGAILSKYAGGSLAAGDEYSKTVLYQAQVRALAMREGVAQGMDAAALKNHIATQLAEPSSAIRADAVTFANYGTFTKELGESGQAIQRIISRNPALRFVVPFVRTPANIFKFTFERTPLAVISRKVRDDLSAGGARQASALAKIGMGSSILAIGADLSQNGIVTGGGPSDPKLRAGLRQTGWQPYSIKIGDSWYSYGRLEPVATLLGMSADMSEILSNYEAYDIDAQLEADELLTAMTMAAGNQVVGKTFLRGFSDLVEMLSDPGRYGEGYLEKYAGSFVPAGVATIERAVSPEMEETFNMVDRVKSRIPGFSESVPKRRNIWGEEIMYFTPNEKSLVGATAERMLSLFNPIYYSAEKEAPVDQWMLKNGFSINMPPKRQSFDGVKIDLRDYPDIYENLVKYRGSEISLLKYGDQTMKEFFTNLATEEDPYGRHIGFFMAIGNNFDDQQNFISQVVSDYNNAAKDLLLDEYPELNEVINRERRNALKLQAVRPPAQTENDILQEVTQ